MRVARETLYAEVWAEPMTTVAQKYAISSNFLARVCERLNVPRPTRGYWAQIKVGRKLAKPPLPAPRAGDELEWCRDGSKPAVCTDPAPATSKAGRQARRPSTHPLLLGAQSHFEAGRVRTYETEKYLKPNKRNIVDVLASKNGLQHALKVASEIFLALEARGHRVVFAPNEGDYVRLGYDHRDREDTGKKRDLQEYQYGGGIWRGPARPTLAFINSVAIGLSIFELAEEVEVRYVGGDGDRYVRVGSPEERALGPLQRPHDWTTRQSLTTGRVALHAYAPTRAFEWERYWREKKAGDLPKMSEAIAKELEAQVAVILALEKKAREEAEERKRKWEIERQEMEKREAERRKVEEEKARLEELKAQLDRWRFARDARAFATQLEDIVHARNLRISPGGPLEERLEWILARAMDADPFAQLRKDVDEMAAKHRTWMKPAKSPLGTMLRLRRQRRCSCGGHGTRRHRG